MFTYRARRPAATAVSALATLLAVSLMGVTTAAGAPPPPVLIVDAFEYTAGLPSGTDANGVPIGYNTFNGAGSTIALANPDTPPAPVNADNPAQNKVLQLDLDVTSYAGVIHSFENAAVDTWVPQDWSAYEGFTMWLYGLGSNSTLFVDLLENRNPGSVKDDAQRWTVDVKDDFTGWKQLEIPFSAFTLKTVGNGAPTDAFERYEMHGWAIGALGTGGPRTYYVDDVGVYGVAPIAPLAVSFTTANYNVEEGTTGDITVKLNRPLLESDPAEVTVDYATEASTLIAGREYTPASGTLTFAFGGSRQLSFPLVTFDDTKDESDERVILRLSNLSEGLNPGFATQAAATVTDNDAYDPLLLDDFETYPYLWQAGEGVELDNPEIAAADPNAVPGQGAYEHVLKASVPESEPVYRDQIQGVIDDLAALLPTSSAKVTRGIASAIKLLDTSLDPKYWDDGLLDAKFGKIALTRIAQAEKELGKIVKLGGPEAAAVQAAIDDLVAINPSTTPRYGGALVRDFPIGQDWSASSGLEFWYYGQNTGDEIAVELLDNRAADPGSGGWGLTWSDEFDGPANTAPDPANWSYEYGDGTLNGIPGWGNDELQYYTDSTDNVATDGNGNLVITARDADGSQQCYYGPCKYTSARLLSANKTEAAYGRIESRIQVPPGEDGLWPAFWSLGTDINRVGWPQTGEIDIMEYVSRVPDEVFGTIHGPGYSGGESFGDIQNIPGVADQFHTYAIEWEPDLIKWYVDDILYHTATPADVAPNEWVFNDPVYLLLNMAIGGNFGGAVSDLVTFPQEMTIDYVRVYQGPDTAERFEAPFVDDFTGWQLVSVPFTDFTRSSVQPAGAPDDGLGLDEVWGYGFRLPDGSASSSVMLDQVRLDDSIPPTVTITDNITDAVASGDVTFTFDFSESVGSSFTAGDIDLTGGAKGAFARVDASTYTLAAKPPADSTGTLVVTVAAGAVTDLAGNANTAGATAEQDYVTPPPPSGGFVITFDEDPAPVLTGFGGAAGTVVADPTDATNKVAQVVKTAGAEIWAGTTVSTGTNFSVPVITFTADRTTMSARVWSPDAGIPVRLKVENSVTGSVSVETDAITTVAGGWETLTFDFANESAGTAALSLAATYDKVSIFFDFGTAGANKTYYLDDLTWPAPPSGFVITFDEVPAPVLTGFGGANGTVVADPTDATNKVAQVVKTAGSEVWAGTTVSTGTNFSVPVITFTADTTTMSARVWSPDAGIPVRLKVENSVAGSVSVETEAITTVAGGWETLTFDFANEVSGTAVLDLAATYDKVSVFFDFGTLGANKTYYLDDLTWP